MNRDRLYLEHMRDCLTKIIAFTAEGREAFLTDARTQDAVLRDLHVMAESS